MSFKGTENEFMEETVNGMGINWDRTYNWNTFSRSSGTYRRKINWEGNELGIKFLKKLEMEESRKKLAKKFGSNLEEMGRI